MDFSTGWINGRTLNKSILSTGANHSFGKFSPTERVPIELPRDLYALGAELVHATPFVVGRNTFVTAHDFDRLQTIFEFANFRFTENALKSAAKEVTSDPLTIDLERRGDLHTESAPANAIEFSQQVCIWGAGQRVWGNLTRHYSRHELSAMESVTISLA